MATITNVLNPPSRAWRMGRRVLRWIGRVLAALVGLIVVLGLVGASYEAIAAAGDARRYPPPGQLVDVGGYRLHIQCVGAGSPTVVLDAGLGGSSLDWNLVQPELGRTTRVCLRPRRHGLERPKSAATYPAPDCRRAAHAVDQCGHCGPYVLVGHSLTGRGTGFPAGARGTGEPI